MASAASAGEPKIPPLPPQADRAAMGAALCRLLWLATWLTLMRLLGYRLSRHRARPAAPRPARIPVAPASLASPRRKPRKHRSIDRRLCLTMLANINTKVAAAQAPAGASPIPRRPALRPVHRALPAPRPRSIAVVLPATPPSQPASVKIAATQSLLSTPVSFRLRNGQLVRPAPTQARPPGQRQRTR
jgi:hypothetical protein